MLDPLPISQVEIVGYANKLTPSALPAVVPPVFRSKTKPEEYFLPPYVLQSGHVWNASKIDEKELLQIEERDEVTLFTEHLLEARPDYELWIDVGNQPHYEPIPDAEDALRTIAKECIRAAEEALKAGDYATAKDMARKAMCADDRFLEPLAIRAVIAQKQNEPAQRALMTKLASTRFTEGGFNRMVTAYKETLVPATCNCPGTDIFTQHPIRGMALLHAA